jgi:hypothetical protein
MNTYPFDTTPSPLGIKKTREEPVESPQIGADAKAASATTHAKAKVRRKPRKALFISVFASHTALTMSQASQPRLIEQRKRRAWLLVLHVPRRPRVHLPSRRVPHLSPAALAGKRDPAGRPHGRAPRGSGVLRRDGRSTTMIG